MDLDELERDNEREGLSVDRAARLVAYAKGLRPPADDADPADADWLAGDHGFAYSPCGTALVKSLGGGWEVVCGVREHRDRVEARTLSVHYCHATPPKLEAVYAVEDNPTRGAVRRLLVAMGR